MQGCFDKTVFLLFVAVLVLVAFRDIFKNGNLAALAGLAVPYVLTLAVVTPRVLTALEAVPSAHVLHHSTGNSEAKPAECLAPMEPVYKRRGRARDDVPQQASHAEPTWWMKSSLHQG